MDSDNKNVIRVIVLGGFLYGLVHVLGKLLGDLPDWIGTIIEIPLILGGIALSVWLWQIIGGDSGK